jgi:chromodomain-helicase-DNA-binding protein 4
VHQQEVAAWQSTQSSGQGGSSTSPPKRDSIEATETTGFLCNWCSGSRADTCLGCDEPLPKSELPTTTEESGLELLFRCVTCTRACHYAHLHPPSDDESYDAVALAVHYQTENLWKCADCASFVYKVDKIIAWRPSPASATEPVYGPLQTPDYTQPLPREYLVKWQDRAYKRVSWVPHMWLLATNKLRLRKFVAEGRTVKLLENSRPDESLDATGDVDTVMDVDPPQPQDEDEMFSVTKRAALLAPVPDAERRIPAGWLTVDRVLSILLLRDPAKEKQAKKVAKRTKNKTRVDSDDDDDDDPDALSPEVVADREDAYDHGEQPRDDFTLDLEQWEKRKKQKLSVDELDDVIWCLIKWEDLGYDESEFSRALAWSRADLVRISATWDAPPRRGEPGFAAFERAFQRYVASREIDPPKGPSLKKRPRNGFKTQGHFFKDGTQPVLGQSSSFKLMDYQVRQQHQV